MSNITNIAGNLNLSGLKKKRYTIDDDPNRVLELDTSDMSILDRVSEAVPSLIESTKKVSEISDDATTEQTAEILKETDKILRDKIDWIFDSNVSEVCAPRGYMFDIINGELRFEIILTAIVSLYGENIEQETKKLVKRMKSHTDKYTKK